MSILSKVLAGALALSLAGNGFQLLHTYGLHIEPFGLHLVEVSGLTDTLHNAQASARAYKESSALAIDAFKGEKALRKSESEDAEESYSQLERACLARMNTASKAHAVIRSITHAKNNSVSCGADGGTVPADQLRVVWGQGGDTATDDSTSAKKLPSGDHDGTGKGAGAAGNGEHTGSADKSAGGRAV